MGTCKGWEVHDQTYLTANPLVSGRIVKRNELKTLLDKTRKVFASRRSRV